MTAAHLDRSFGTVGAADVLAAALGAGSPRDAARRLRDVAPTLDLAEARATAQRDGRAAVIAADTESGGALGVRWFEVEVRARRGAETVQWRALHALHVRDGKVAEHVTYCSGQADAAAIACQDAEAPMVRP